MVTRKAWDFGIKVDAIIETWQCSEDYTVHNVLNPACTSSTPMMTQHIAPKRSAYL